jgi:hypothetical protein
MTEQHDRCGSGAGRQVDADRDSASDPPPRLPPRGSSRATRSARRVRGWLLTAGHNGFRRRLYLPCRALVFRQVHSVSQENLQQEIFPAVIFPVMRYSWQSVVGATQAPPLRSQRRPIAPVVTASQENLQHVKFRTILVVRANPSRFSQGTISSIFSDGSY